MKTVKQTLTGLIAVAILLAGCKSMNKSQKGAVIGTAAGGAAGAVIGKASGNTALGAIIGATVGGVTGAVIGRQMDKQAKDIEREVPGAEVKRVGEGIVVEFNEKVLFGFDSYALSSSAENNLDNLSEVLKEYPDTNIEIQGHTDSRGTERYNQSLSEKRASSVASYLRGTGISGSRIITKGYGENAPVASNSTDEGRSQNRRVNFLITANEKMIEEARKEANTK